MAVTLTNSFEGGTNGAALTVGNTGGLSGSAFGLITTGPGASIAFDNTHVAHGTLACKVTSGTSFNTAFGTWNITAAGQVWFRLYLFFTGNPTAQLNLLFFSNASNTLCGRLVINTTGKLIMMDGGGVARATMTTSMPTGAWFRVEGFMIGSATVGQVSMSRYDTMDSGTATETQASAATLNTTGAIANLQLGCTNANGQNITFWMDDLGMSDTAALGPSKNVTDSDASAAVDTAGRVLSDAGSAGDEIITIVVTQPVSDPDIAAAVEGIQVTKLPVSQPAAASVWRPPAVPQFFVSAMPRVHIQNLVTRQWITRDARGVVNPLITWNLNQADTFTCTFAPPDKSLMDASGNPVIREWQSAIYLEEADQIKMGGIVTSATGQGPQWTVSAIGFAGFPNGQPYEGNAIDFVSTDALDVIRFIWSWLQGMPGGDIGMRLSQNKSGVLLGNNIQPQAKSSLAQNSAAGSNIIKVVQANAGWQRKMKVTLGDQQNVIIDIGGSGSKFGLGSPQFLWLRDKTNHWHNAGEPFVSTPIPIPHSLQWWNSTDLGNEIASIQQEAVFDWTEWHEWSDRNKTDVIHHLDFNVPRRGRRLDGAVRFAEGENITVPAQVTRDGSTFANNVVVLGAGQGRSMIRASTTELGDRLRRTFVYTDQTVRRTDRASVKAHRQLVAHNHIDTPTQVTVTEHRSAPFSAFQVGDDIPVMLASGWRNATIWARITSIARNPQTNTATLTLARSDSFSYMAESGVAGTI